MASGSESLTMTATASLFAPPIEETMKGLAVLLIFLIFKNEFDSILDGIVYASVAALGFAATENIFYIFKYGYSDISSQQGNWLATMLTISFVRVIMVGWQHPFYTSFFGIGLAIARLNQNRKVKIIAILAGWTLAVLTHSIHNTLSGMFSGSGWMFLTTALDWSGWLVMFLFIIWALYREQHWIITQLKEEVSLGSINLKQYSTASSAWAVSIARLIALFKGHYRQTSRFYQVTSELAFVKQHRQMFGEEQDNTGTIDKLRAELKSLAPEAVA